MTSDADSPLGTTKEVQAGCGPIRRYQKLQEESCARQNPACPRRVWYRVLYHLGEAFISCLGGSDVDTDIFPLPRWLLLRSWLSRIPRSASKTWSP